MKLTVVKGFRRTEIAAWARVVSDGLTYFNGVSAAGCAHAKVVVGSGRAAVEYSEFRWVNALLGNVKSAWHLIMRFAPSMRSAIWLSSNNVVVSVCPTSSRGYRAQNPANAGKAAQDTFPTSSLKCNTRPSSQ